MQNDELYVKNKISIVTFACSLLVIWIHTYNLETYGINEESVGFLKLTYYIENIWGNLTLVAVPFFFFISGFLFFRHFELSKILDKYLSRLHSVLIPYLIWCTFYYILLVLKTNMPIVNSFVSAEFTTFSLRGYLAALWVNEYYVLWFLKELILYIALCPVLYFAFKKPMLGLLSLSILILLKYFIAFEIPLSGYIYYCLGVYISLNYKKVAYFRNRTFSFLSCLFIILMAILRFSLLSNPVILLLFFSAVWLGLDLLPINDKQLPWWMNISFFTYVAHDIFLESYEKVYLIVFGNNAFMALLAYIVIPAFVFLTLVVMAWLLRKYFFTIWNVINGKR